MPLLSWCLVWGLASICPAQVKTTRYQEDLTVFANPERGFYVHANLHELDPRIGKIRREGHTLVWGKVMMRAYRDSPALPEDFLERIDAGFRIARDQGVKVIVRGSYGHRGSRGDYESYTDPPKEHIKNHLRQLAPIFAANADVIALFEAGFIGPWGEWHTTAIAQDYDQGREMLLFILDHTPADRMIAVRYPYLKQRVFRLPAGGFAVVDAANAYSGLPVARMGHHNDCFLSSPTDVGTYDRGGSARAEETAYLAAETLYTVYGGESCRPHELNDGRRAIRELGTLHGTYLNRGYHPKVLAKWQTQGCFDEIARRLGARLVPTESRISAGARPGGTLAVQCDLKNVGFASLYNPRDVEIVLENEADGRWFRFELDVDPRRWKPGERYTLSEQIALRPDMPEGSYTVYLNLPDPYAALHDDPRYAFRLAAKDVWDPATGLNKLTGGITLGGERPDGDLPAVISQRRPGRNETR